MTTPPHEAELMLGPNYVQHEQWFEIKKYEGYTLVINSYGRLRKLLHDGGYQDVHNGGVKHE